MVGLLNIDKPLGMTSHDVVARLRRICQTKKIGHAGTLDPLATGVLLACVGRATRLIEYLVGHDKRYDGIIRLGQETNTYDAEGEITQELPLPESLGLPQIEAVFPQFTGSIEQAPPIYSAIKKDGQPLYKLARAGKTVEVPMRSVTIHALESASWASPDLQITTHVSSGTYIRSLAHDIGQALGVGGHLVGLRRTAVGRFGLDTAVPLDALTPETVESYLIPPEAIVAHLDSLSVIEEEAQQLAYGRWIAIADGREVAEGAKVSALHADGRFLGILRAEAGWWKPEKLFV